METLYLNHLVEEPSPGRYRLHDLIRHFAETLVAADPDVDTDAVVDRVLDYYLHVATEAARLLPHHDAMPTAAAPRRRTCRHSSPRRTPTGGSRGNGST